jgi:cyanophycin synthetase
MSKEAKVPRLRGLNAYFSQPVVVVLVDLQELTGRETTDVPGFTARLLALLPGLAEHHCAATRPGGLIDEMTGGMRVADRTISAARPWP